MTPSFLALPDRFTEFRPAQTEAIEYAVFESTKRFRALGLPTGSGKSLLGWAIARVLGGRAMYLVATRGLQDQLLKEFSGIGVRDVRGKSNYRCGHLSRSYNRWTSCEEGADRDCPWFGTKSSSCEYQEAVRLATLADLDVSNYSYWLHARGHNPAALTDQGLDFNTLICDECGSIEEELGRFLEVRLGKNEADLWVKPGDYGFVQGSAWGGWAKEKDEELAERRRNLKRAGRTDQDPEIEDLDEFLTKMTKIMGMSIQDDWVWQADEHGVGFKCVHPGRYAGRLWQNIPNVILMSATLRPYSLRLNGLREEEYDFREWPAVFPPHLGPVYFIKDQDTVSLSWKSTDEDYKKIVDRVDEILDGRRDRKGIIHSVSYSRANRILEGSRHKDRFIFNKNGSESMGAAMRFKNSRPESGAVLVGPSYSTGWDFPGEDAEFQIILKVPFPNTTDFCMEQRCKDQSYRIYTAMQELVQMCGRGRRFPGDRCETMILDGKIAWLMSAATKMGHKPGWFQVWTKAEVPKPPQKIVSP